MHLLILQLYQELVEVQEQFTITLVTHRPKVVHMQMGVDLVVEVTILTHSV